MGAGKLSIDPGAYEHITLELRDDVLHVTLDRPEVLNAVNLQFHKELVTLFGALRHQPSLGAVILSGRGRAFCAGGDAAFFRGATPEQVDEMFAEARTLVENLLAVQAPVIAAVNGPAIGLGATIALFCDVVIMDEEAVLADPHVRMGVVAGDGGAIIWPLRMGMRAKRFLMTGDPITAQDARQAGLVDEVVAAGTVLDVAQKLAMEFAEGPRLAIAGTKAAVNHLLGQAVASCFEVGAQLEKATMTSADHAEAVAAFEGKRPPRFTGR